MENKNVWNAVAKEVIYIFFLNFKVATRFINAPIHVVDFYWIFNAHFLTISPLI